MRKQRDFEDEKEQKLAEEKEHNLKQYKFWEKKYYVAKAKDDIVGADMAKRRMEYWQNLI